MANISNQQLSVYEKMAVVLVDYSAAVRPKETVLISGTTLAAPLIREVYRRVLTKGAIPLLRLTIPEIENEFYSLADDYQLKHVSKIAFFEAKNVDAAIYCQSESNTKYLSEIDPAKIAEVRKSRKALNDIVHARVRWTLTLFPTPAYAQDAGMPLCGFERFVAGAMFADRDDPVGEWKKLSKSQEKFVNRLNGAGEVRIVGEDTDIVMSVKGRKFINSDGHRNMPSGEVFTGPVENSVNGFIRFTYPVCYSGKEVSDIFLRFKDGRVVEAKAGANEGFLKEMLKMDRGAGVVGELGIGTNYGIDRFIKNILFDEKIGGTVHLALGSSYTETGGKNKSALHWDMIKDLRRGGEIIVDGEAFQRDGKFL